MNMTRSVASTDAVTRVNMTSLRDYQSTPMDEPVWLDVVNYGSGDLITPAIQ